MRILFTGGGTGGHIFPNIAVIGELKKSASVECRYVGSRGGPEADIAFENGIPFYGIHAGKLRRYFDWENFTDACKAPLGFFESLLLLKKLKPDLVFAKGGYVSVPVVFAARALSVPVWLHESDVSPGLANRLCSRFAGKIWLSFEESRRYFAQKKVEVVGNPVRRGILRGEKEKGFALTGFSPERPVVLIMGGSSGAQALNELVKGVLPELLEAAQVVHITGQAVRKQIPGYRSFPFLREELAHVYAMADLAVSRAGSGAIFEMLACHVPMILIPLPRRASRGDQIENAALFQQHGWAVAFGQETLTPEILLGNIRTFLTSRMLRAAMIERQKKAPFSDAAGRIAEAMKKARKTP